jgi:hypothetical protein
VGLTLADLQEWDPEQINELADGAAARARHSREAVQNIANLPVFSISANIWTAMRTLFSMRTVSSG